MSQLVKWFVKGKLQSKNAERKDTANQVENVSAVFINKKLRDVQQRAKENKFLQVIASFR